MEKVIGAIIGFALLVAVVSVIMAFPVMWCWNWVMPDIFGLAESSPVHRVIRVIKFGILGYYTYLCSPIFNLN